MKTSDIIRRAGRNLLQAKGRTILTSLAIAVGATTITLALAAGEGGRAYIAGQQEARGLGQFASIEVSPQFKESTAATPQIQEYTSAPPADSAPTTLTQSDNVLSRVDQQTLEAIEGVKQVVPSGYPVSGDYITQTELQKRFVAPYLSIMNGQIIGSMVAGRFPREPVPGEAVMTADYLEPLGFTSAKQAVGRTIQLGVSDPVEEIQTVALKIVGVTDTSRTSQTLFVSPMDGEMIYQLQTGLTSDELRFYGFTVLPQEGVTVEEVKSVIVAKGYSAYSSEDGRESTTQAINIAQWGLVGFGMLALLASVFGIVNTQFISVLERTQQIGLMRALGARRKDIGRLFRYEAAWVGFLGGVIGTAVALLVGLANPLIADMFGLEKGTTLLVFNPLSSGILIAGLMLIAVAAGYFPSRKASKLEPVEALRTE